MKKILLTTSLLCIIFFTNAQKGWYMVANGQANASYIMNQNSYGSPELNYKTTIGYGGNIGAGLNFNNEIGLQLNAGITKTGQKYADDFKIGPQKFEKNTKDVDLTYMTVGLLFRYAPILSKQEYVDDPKIKLVIMVGPQLNWLAKANVSYERAGAEVGYPFAKPELDYKPVGYDRDLFQKIMVSGVVSVGIDYLITPKFFLNAAIRTEVGFNDINSKAYRKHEGYGSSRILNPGLQFGLGFFFSRD